MKKPTLSKSSYAAGLQCHKRLWIEKNDRSLVPAVTASQQAIFDQGHEIGEWSHKLYPDGVLLRDELDFQSHLKASREALSKRKALFEPAFSIPGAYARADILVPVGSTDWDLLEVKSATDVWENKHQIKDVYLQDIAFQLFVYRQAGLSIRKCFLVFLNREYVRHGEIDPSLLFSQEEVTSQVEALLPGIPHQLEQLSTMLQKETASDVPIGPHCLAPYECSLKAYCWKDVPKDSVFSLTRAGAQAWKWWNDGIVRVKDLPLTEEYSAKQAIQIKAERSHQTHLDVEAIRGFLDGLTYPLYFLDFETVMPAVPPFDGCRPYAQVPFQFSLHVQNSPGGEVTHLEYLAKTTEDPRPGFLSALRDGLGNQGSIVSYNSAFEISRLKELSTVYPEHAEWIETTVARFDNADLLKPFRSFSIYHPSQHGSASIKAVLPAFTDLSYKDLPIAEGGTASQTFLRCLKGGVPPEEVSILCDQLRRYCELDTLAMVRLVEKLHQIVGA